MKRIPTLLSLALLMAACGHVTPTAPVESPLATLQLDVSGLPASQAADVQIRGPFSSETATVQLTSSQTFTSVPLGQYDVTAQPVSAGGVTYTPSVDPGSVTLDAQHLSGEVHVSYAPPSTGTLSIHVAGAPSGSQAALHLTRPDGSVQVLSGSEDQTLSGLAPGKYSLSGDTIQAANTRYVASVNPQEIEIQAGQTTTATVSYTRVDALQGAAAVRLLGLPDGANPSLVLTDAGGNPHPFTNGSVLPDLPPGPATVPAQDVLIGGMRFHTAGASITVVAGQSAALSLSFQAVSGALKVVVNSPVALPGDLVQVSATHFSKHLAVTSTLPDLTPGDYSVTAQGFTQGGYTYAPSVSPELLSVKAGLTAGVTVTYVPQAADAGVSADVTPPSVTLDADPSGAYAMLTGSASDASGPVSVDVYDATTLLGHLDGVNGSWQLAWNQPTAGPHDLTVIATDPSGNTSQLHQTVQVSR